MRQKILFAFYGCLAMFYVCAPSIVFANFLTPTFSLGFKTPKEAMSGHYIDKKCPFTGDINIRGRILTGVVVSTKMKRTIIIRREYLHYIPKYNRYEKRHKNLAAHCSPCFIGLKAGDTVTVGECRPLSKTVRFNVLRVQKKAGSSKKFEKF